MDSSLRYFSIVSKLLLVAAVLLFPGSQAGAQGFLRADGRHIVDGEGNPVILRGHSPGGWMLQEGYMLQMSEFANAQHQIRAKIEDVLGPEQTEAFYDKWYENHFTRHDLALMARMGFNSIRLPMHYNLFTLPIELEPVAGENTWLERGFTMVDSVLSWCAEHEMYLILDMHAAPGGQGRDMAISDYDPSKPSLWESELNQSKLVALWKKIAERYADEPWIGGYDLINEPNWSFTGNNINGCDENANLPLRQLYIRITEAIREVDTNHIIFIEGNCWANNFRGLTPPWDDNMVYSFHKYWSVNDQASLQFVLNIRNSHNVPIWCGEAGENSNHWFTEAVRLLEANDIGWAWWSWKKFDSQSGIVSVVPPAGYNTLRNYWRHGGAKPSAAFATDVMMELADRLRLERCSVNWDVADALIRQADSDELKPFNEHVVPGLIYATDYDMGRNGIAYLDDVYQTTHVSGGSFTAWNNGWSYRNDGVDIERCNDTFQSNGFNVGWTSPGEWMKYSFTAGQTASYRFRMRFASWNARTTMRIMVNDVDITPLMTMSSSGGWQTWRSVDVHDVILEEGRHVLKVKTVSGGANLSFFEFSNPQPVGAAAFIPLLAESSEDGDIIYLIVNNHIKDSLPAQIASAFKVFKAGEELLIDSIGMSSRSDRILALFLKDKFYDGDVIGLSYAGQAVFDIYGRELAPFEHFDVINNTPARHRLPGLIQVEDYYHQQGLRFETAHDAGGGLNFGHTSNGDFIDYLVRITQAGTYVFNYRIAAVAGNGVFQVQLFDEDNNRTVVGNYSVPATGGWQAWRTVTSEISLPEGVYRLRIFIVSREFNMNWFSVTNLITTANRPVTNNTIKIYPNPADQFIHIDFPIEDQIRRIEIISHDGALRLAIDDPAPGIRPLTVNTGSLPPGMYLLRVLSVNNRETFKFVVTRQR